MSNHCILIVDDDQDIVRGTRVRLKAAGYDTIEARDGVDGVLQAIRHRPSAILMDVRMPRADGLSALETLQIRNDTRETPVVMLSASLRDKSAALDAGAKRFLRKPFQGANLVSAIDEVVTQPTIDS